MATMIKLITLDLDNTLWDVTPVLVRAEQQVSRFIASEYPELAPHYQKEVLLKIRNDILDQHPELKNLPTRFRKKVLHLLFTRCNYPEHEIPTHVNRVFDHFLEYRNQIELFPETTPLLTNLSQNHTLIALSNGNADIHRVGLGQFFAAHFSAESTGKPKPDPTMFLKALEYADVKPHQAIHVGDHPEEDVAAARQIGMHTIWFNQNNERRLDCGASAEIHSLAELPNAIESIQSP